MSNILNPRKVLTVLALLAAVCLLAPAYVQAGTTNCRYELNIENQADQSIQVQKIKWKKKDGSDWKNWHTVESGPDTLADDTSDEYKQIQDTVFCYRHKWKLQWKCSADSTWHDYDIPPDDPDNDRVSNWYLLVTGCGESDVARSEDGDFI